MKTKIPFGFGLTLAILVFVFMAPARAATVTVDGVYTNVVALDIRANDGWVVTNGGVLDNAGANIGSQTGNSNAFVLVTGTGSFWTNTGSAYIGGGNDSHNNTFTLASNAQAGINGMVVGNGNGAGTNTLIVTDNGTTLTLTGGNIRFGDNGADNLVLVTNGGRIVSLAPVFIGNDGTGLRQTTIVTGSNSVLDASSTYLLAVGWQSPLSMLNVNGGGLVSGTVVNVGVNASASNSSLVVQGAGSRVVATTSVIVGGNTGAGGSSGNSLVVSNNAQVLAGISLGNHTGAYSNQMMISSGGLVSNVTLGASIGGAGGLVSGDNTVLVEGTGSRWVMNGLYVGSSSSRNRLVISNGGAVYNVGGTVRIADTAGVSNSVTITGGNSLWSVPDLGLGWEGAFNLVLVTNGGRFASSGAVYLGSSSVASTNNALRVSGAGSVASANALYVGSSGANTYGSNGVILVNDGGTIEANALAAFSSGVISNSGGIFQFTAAPTLTLLDNGAIAVENGTISFRDTASATATMLAGITYTGSNSFRLFSATNATGTAAYSVAAGSPSTTYQKLVLAGTNSQWRSGTLGIASSGAMLVTNAVGASVAAAVTATGDIRVIHSTVTWQSNVVVSGLYFSDPSTNTFATNLTVTASGALSGSNGDLFVFNSDFINQSTNRTQFNLAYAGVLFTNGASATNHVLDLTGSGALDMGSNWINAAQLATNFSIGTLSLAGGNTLSLTGGVANALYVGTLDLQGLASTNDLASRLWLGVNLYYDQAALGNAYLNGKVYDLPGAGLLIPIPEPTPLMALGAGLALLAFLRRRHAA